MQALLVPILGVLLLLLAIAAVARHFAASARQRSALSVVLVALGLVTAFFLFFGAGSWFRTHRAQPRPHASASPHEVVASLTTESAGQSAAIRVPDCSLHNEDTASCAGLRVRVSSNVGP